jgi:hypothetical protein
MRDYFSTHLLWTGLHVTELAAAIEARHTGRSHFDLEHRGHVLSAVLSAAGFMEAVVNELFQDAVDGHGLTGDGVLAALPSAGHRLMARMWTATRGGRALRPLDKYNLLLSAVGKEPLDRGAQPAQDAQLLVNVRNAIAHYQPEDLSVDIPHRLERQLRRKFEDNRLMSGSANAWWPDHCLGAGCARWACQSALALADFACDQAGITPNYRRIAQGGWMGMPPWPPAPELPSE